MRVSAGVQPICDEGESDPRRAADGFLLQDCLEPKPSGSGSDWAVVMWCWGRQSCRPLVRTGVCPDEEDYYRPVRRRDTQVGPLCSFDFYTEPLSLSPTQISCKHVHCLSGDFLIRTEGNEKLTASCFINSEREISLWDAETHFGNFL